MRIVHHFARISETGGVPRAVCDLTRLLAAAGHEVTLLTAADSELPASWIACDPGRPAVARIEPPAGLFRLLSARSLARAAEILATNDVLHLHGTWRPCSTQISRLARRLGKPYVLSLHGMLNNSSMRQGSVRKRLYHLLFERRNLDRAQLVCATSQRERQQASRWIPHDRITVIPLAVDLEPYRKPVGPELFLARHPEADSRLPVVLFLARLHPAKRPDILIEAAGLLRRRGIECQLLVAGPGKRSYRRRLRRLARRHGVADRTLFLGSVTGAEKLSLYHFADVLGLPTTRESFGLVLVESLACGTPVITTRGTDIWRQLERSGGSLIADQTADSFAAAIEELARRPERRRAMGREGRQRVFEWLDARGVIARYEEMYRAVVGA